MKTKGSVSLVRSIDTCRSLKNHFSLRGTRAALRARLFTGNESLLHLVHRTRWRSLVGQFPPPPVTPPPPVMVQPPYAEQTGLVDVCLYVIRIATRLMSNGAIYLEHAGMLISIYNGFVLIAISRMRENPRVEGKIERCRNDAVHAANR